MLKMTKRLSFDAGHRLMNHESKCANVHGHRYDVDVTIELLGQLDRAGRIVDFGDVKRSLGAWIDDNLDHGFIANKNDTAAIEAMRALGTKLFVLESEPSAEAIASFLFDVASAMLNVKGERRVSRIVVFETPTSSAEAT